MGFICWEKRISKTSTSRVFPYVHKVMGQGHADLLFPLIYLLCGQLLLSVKRSIGFMSNLASKSLQRAVITMNGNVTIFSLLTAPLFVEEQSRKGNLQASSSVRSCQWGNTYSTYSISYWRPLNMCRVFQLGSLSVTALSMRLQAFLQTSVPRQCWQALTFLSRGMTASESLGYFRTLGLGPTTGHPMNQDWKMCNNTKHKVTLWLN
jgi:hypothetical protein